MGMTMSQKILAAHAGLDEVKAGQLIEAKLDMVLGNDVTSPVAINVFEENGATAVFAPQEEKPSEEQSEEATSRPAHRKRTVGRGKKTSVISLIDEYETPGVANVKRESGVQMSFDFDSESSSLSDKD